MGKGWELPPHKTEEEAWSEHGIRRTRKPKNERGMEILGEISEEGGIEKTEGQRRPREESGMADASMPIASRTWSEQRKKMRRTRNGEERMPLTFPRMFMNIDNTPMELSMCPAW